MRSSGRFPNRPHDRYIEGSDWRETWSLDALDALEGRARTSLGRNYPVSLGIRPFNGPKGLTRP